MNIGASLSGLLAANTKFDVAANDIANANTGGYRQKRTEFGDTKQGVEIQAITKPVDDSASSEDGTSSNVSLAEEMTELTTARHAYGANARALQTQLETQGTLFDQRV
ncbi:MAG: hypothetical protein JHC95_22975 [Solirubrobacteraceae bacterium]|nr:hypothetical protein [Solirubrobacteraceae bacterium]